MEIKTKLVMTFKSSDDKRVSITVALLVLMFYIHHMYL